MITEKQMELRRSHIGGSDVAAILGCDPFRNAWDVWAQKSGLVADDNKIGPSARIGRILEMSAMFWAQEQLGKIIKNQQRSFKKWPVIMVNTDGIVKATGEPVEGKTTNITYRAPDFDEWGEPETDQVPERVILQCTVQMMACEAQLCHVPAIIGGRGFVMYHIQFDKELAEIIYDRLRTFWEMVSNHTPPENIVPNIEIVKRLRRLPQTVVDVPDELVERWLRAKDAKKELTEIEEKAQAAVLAAMGTSEGGKYKDGLVTYYEQTRRDLDKELLEVDHPEIIEKYTKVTKYRVARIKKPKQLKKGKI